MRRILLALSVAAILFDVIGGAEANQFVGGARRAIVMNRTVTGLIEDTFTLSGIDNGKRSFLLGFVAEDTTLYMTTKNDSSGASLQGWPLLSNQYWPDPNRYEDGDTIVFRCRVCATGDNVRLKIRVFFGQD